MSQFFQKIINFQRENEGTDGYRNITTAVSTPLGPQIVVQQHNDVLSFNTLQYLGDLGVPRIMQSYLNDLGSGLACSPLILQTNAVRECEDAIADFKGFPRGSCLMLNSGYLAAKSVIEFMIGQNLMILGDNVFRKRLPIIVFIDEYTHISLQRPLLPFRKGELGPSQKVKTVTYRHLDYADLEEKFVRYAHVDADRLIVTDTVFSMHGDAINVRIIHDLAKKYFAEILLDTAHDDGVYGHEGRGLLHVDGLEDLDRSIFIEVGTLSKVFACGLGGYIIFPNPEIANFARKAMEAYIFAAGLPPYIAATAHDVVGLIRSPQSEELRRNLHRLSSRTLIELKNEGFNTLNANTHIIPIQVGDELCHLMHSLLLAKGISVGDVYWPAIEKGKAILRTILTALHTEDHVDRFLCTLKKVRDEVYHKAT